MYVRARFKVLYCVCGAPINEPSAEVGAGFTPTTIIGPDIAPSAQARWHPGSLNAAIQPLRRCAEPNNHQGGRPGLSGLLIAPACPTLQWMFSDCHEQSVFVAPLAMRPVESLYIRLTLSYLLFCESYPDYICTSHDQRLPTEPWGLHSPSLA